MQDRIKEHNGGILLARTETSAVSLHTKVESTPTFIFFKVKAGNLFQASDQVRIGFSFVFDWLG